MSEKMSDPREVLSDFMLQGHLRYETVGRASDYDRTDAMIRDLAAEGVAIISAAKLATLQREADGMREALAGLEQYFDRAGENSIERYERIAAQFYRETGIMAPGKDVSAAGGQPEHEVRRERYDAWVAAKVAAARAFLPPQATAAEGNVE